MKPLSYLDIHTHRRTSNPEFVSVASLSQNEILSELAPLDYISAGIHPWWTEDHTLQEIEVLKSHILNLVQLNKVWGIGETGIDRAYPELLEQQKELFNWHLELSEKFGLPLIIHSVRAGADFLQILKSKKPSMPWIFHDFRGNIELVNDLIRLHPHSYFSFGMSIDNSPQVRELIKTLPVEHMFLETDEQKHLDIHDIHLRAAHHMNLDMEFLKAQIWHNFNKIAKKPLS